MPLSVAVALLSAAAVSIAAVIANTSIETTLGAVAVLNSILCVIQLYPSTTEPPDDAAW